VETFNDNAAIKLKNISAAEDPQKESVKNISFTISKGEVVAFFNDMDRHFKRSRIMDLITLKEKSSSGRIRINGTVKSISNLSKVFDPKLSGRKNIYLRCERLGMSRLETEIVESEIIHCSKIENCVDRPVEKYTDEQKMCLALMIDSYIKRDIQIVNWAMEIKDENLIDNIRNKTKNFVDSGGTFIMFSKSINNAKALCKRGIIIKNGEIIADGSIDDICNFYLEITERGIK